MADITSISAALTSVKAATDITKILIGSTKSLNDAELNLKFADLRNQLANVNVDLANIKTLLLEKDAEIEKLKKELEANKAIVWEAPFYFSCSEEEKDGPFCQKCYDSEKKQIRLQEGGRNDLWKCLVCTSFYRGPNYQPPSAQTRRRSGNNWVTNFRK